MIKACAVCGKSFKTCDRNAKYCSPDCSAKGRTKPPLIKICAYCGKEFSPTRNKRAVRFCSMSCSAKGRNKPFLHKTCPTCGKKFSSRNPRAKFCSVACRYSPKPKKIVIPKPARKKNCQACGKSFTPAFTNERFCSDSCRLNYFFSDQDFYARAAGFYQLIEGG